MLFLLFSDWFISIAPNITIGFNQTLRWFFFINFKGFDWFVLLMFFGFLYLLDRFVWAKLLI